MRLSTTLRVSGLALMVTLVGLTTACASGPAGDTDTDTGISSNTETSVDSPAQDAPSGGGDYAFGTDRDQMASAIETAFKSDNGKATWDGDTLILAVDGDATSTMAGFTQCRVLDQLLNEDDHSIIKFPNGEVSCEEVLADI